ncbi:hypothetical protein AGMMS49579_00670 [Spirochaetia bacterium]|nr:hypothetical protein AGMMS49579_00220 [Spirochaetia bacterium]GHV49339.1 hypothetical protein AGMMS49579_00670 [Spirochaetia bacterium]
MAPKSVIAAVISLMFLLGLGPGSYAADRPSVALVLGGGGAKGYAHIAVLELIEELGIPIDMVIGASVGAIVGGLYSAGYTPEMMKDLMFDLDWTGIFQDKPVSPFKDELGVQNFPFNFRLENGLSFNIGGGYSTGEAVYSLFKALTVKIPSYSSFDDLSVPFRAAVIETAGGKLEMIGQGDLAEAIRASMSLPGVFEPFIMDGKRYIDGGTKNNLPVREAKEMGYDIIIAVELFPDAENFDLSPLAVPNQLVDLYFTAANKGQYAFADLVLTPDVREFSLLDFPKSHEIYSRAAADRENFREKLLAIREKIYGTPEAAHPPRIADAPRRMYTELPPIAPQRLVMSGALPSDTGYIEKSFSRLIAGKPLEENTISVFIDSIYKTGHYRFVIARTDIRTGESCLELVLYPDNPAKTLLLAGWSYQNAISSDFAAVFSAGVDLQIRELTGPLSVLSLGASYLNYLSLEPETIEPLTQDGAVSMDSGFSLKLLYLQPLTQKLFISAASELTIGPKDIRQLAILSALGKINLGIRFNDTNTLNLGPAVIFTGDVVPGGEPRLEGSIPSIPADGSGDERRTALCFITGYRFNSLDSQIFAARGLYVNLENTLAFPFPPAGSAVADSVSDSVSVDFSAAIPLNRRFSFIANLFAGTSIHPLFGFSALDRLYFPHLSGAQSRGAHKAAASLILQFEPWENITVLGGQLVFSVSGAAGLVTAEWRQFSFNDLIWNASLNAGIRIGKTFGLRLKAGAGSYSPRPIAPFLSIDIGAFRY